MASHQDAVNFIQSWEGGISGHPSDNASSNASPCGLDPKYNAPIHTNKGVTWLTYKNAVSGANCEEFLLMPEAVWLYIWEQRYFNAVGANTISNQAIANIYASWAWGSGVGGANNQMQSFLMNTYGFSLAEVSSKYQRVLILNELSQNNVNLLFNQLMDARLSYFKGLSDFSVFGVGWSNRLESFKQYNQKYIKKDNKMDITLVIGVLILLGLLILLYFALK